MCFPLQYHVCHICSFVFLLRGSKQCHSRRTALLKVSACSTVAVTLPHWLPAQRHKRKRAISKHRVPYRASVTANIVNTKDARRRPTDLYTTEENLLFLISVVRHCMMGALPHERKAHAKARRWGRVGKS
uniref:Uncharacterized protein n=1 Tax=Rhipicephalus zambeziensis TaxID=60191 RepID=A0A224Y5F0_9ACAR